ncbi:MAG: hypothetical protein WCO37_11415 [Bacteroidota bacterium]
MSQDNFDIIIREFTSKSNLEDRYTSFDYCYNYFKTNHNYTFDIEKSCLTLGFYLASWGMFRGSSFLLQKNARHFRQTIEYISTLDKTIWDIDVDNYDEDNIEKIIEIYREIKGRLILNSENADVTLVTKVLLGVFGFIPAFDQYFCNTFRSLYNNKCGFRRVNVNSLNYVKDFYLKNKLDIDRLSSETFTTNFDTGLKTKIQYPKAKLIDMYGFSLGIKQSKIK